MIGEKLIGVIVIEEGTPEWWRVDEWGEARFSNEYFVTDRGVYQYEGDHVIVRLDNAPEGSFETNISPAYGQIIKEVKSTTDFCIMILFESGDALLLTRSDPKFGIYLEYRSASTIDLTNKYYGYFKPTLIR